MAKGKAVSQSALARIARRIEAAHSRATLMYVAIVAQLLDADDYTMMVPDLSEALGKGRDSSAVQAAVARMVAIGVATRDEHPAEEGVGRSHSVTLTAR